MGDQVWPVSLSHPFWVKKIEYVKRKIESSELPAPEFSCLVNSLRPVFVTKLRGYNRQVKKNYISDSLSE